MSDQDPTDALGGEEPTPDELAARRAEREAEEASIADRADDPEPDPAEPPLPAMAHDRQLSLNIGGRKAARIESEISIMSAGREIEALLDPDVEQQLIVTVVPQKFEYVPVKENGVTVRWKLRQQVRVVHVARVGTEAADAALGAGA